MGNKITVTRSYALGDIVLASAAIEAMIKSGYDVTFRTDPAMIDWLRFSPYNVISYTDPYEEPHITIDNVTELAEDELIEQGRNKNRIEIMCDLLGVLPSQLYPSFYCSPEEWRLVRKIKTMYPQPFIGIAPSSRFTCKTLGYDKWKAVITYLSAIFNGSIFILDSADNLPKSTVLGLKNVHWLQHSLRIMTLYCASMDLMVTQDSLWSHVSASVFVPQLLLTSCTDGGLIANDYYKAIYPKPPMSCSPCWYKFPDKRCGKHNPPHCMDQIDTTALVMGICDTLNNKFFDCQQIYRK